MGSPGAFKPKSLYDKSVETYLTKKSQGIGFANLRGEKEKISEQEKKTLMKIIKKRKKNPQDFEEEEKGFKLGKRSLLGQ